MHLQKNFRVYLKQRKYAYKECNRADSKEEYIYEVWAGHHGKVHMCTYVCKYGIKKPKKRIPRTRRRVLYICSKGWLLNSGKSVSLAIVNSRKKLQIETWSRNIYLLWVWFSRNRKIDLKKESSDCLAKHLWITLINHGELRKGKSRRLKTISSERWKKKLLLTFQSDISTCRRSSNHIWKAPWNNVIVNKSEQEFVLLN